MTTTTLKTIPQTAKGVSLSEHQLIRMIRSGVVRSSKLGRDWVIDAAEVKRLEREFPLSSE